MYRNRWRRDPTDDRGATPRTDLVIVDVRMPPTYTDEGIRRHPIAANRSKPGRFVLS